MKILITTPNSFYSPYSTFTSRVATKLLTKTKREKKTLKTHENSHSCQNLFGQVVKSPLMPMHEKGKEDTDRTPILGVFYVNNWKEDLCV